LLIILLLFSFFVFSFRNNLFSPYWGRFDEVNTELLVCMAALNPANSFAAFDKDKLMKLAKFYPQDFTSTDLV